jgi:DNA-binding transcriptional LysR family regulator
VIPGLAVARAAPGVEVRRLRAGAPARRICAVHPDDSFQPPAVRTMITILETTTRRLRTPAA